MEMFGSDGFRSKFGEGFMDLKTLIGFVVSFGDFYNKNKFKKSVLIGSDTRLSGQIVKNLFFSILNYQGINTEDAGIVPSPGFSLLLSQHHFSFGIMVTASHNPATDNGIKLFFGDGKKMPVAFEKQIEGTIKKPEFGCDFDSQLGVTTKLRKSVFSAFNEWLDLSNELACTKKIMIDCSHGAFSQHLKFPTDNKNIVFCNNKPNGRNINENVGALKTDNLFSKMRTSDSDFGAAFDGDGDRIVFLEKRMGEIPSEVIALLFAKKLSKKLQKFKVVTSEIVNMNFNSLVNHIGGEVIEVKVGDRNVIEAVDHHNALFGFEPSGHFYLPNKNKTMDGLSALKLFINILDDETINYAKFISEAKMSKRIKLDINIENKNFIDVDRLNEKIRENLFHGKEKIVIRQSMWEPVVRVYYDYLEQDRFSYLHGLIKDEIRVLK